MGNTLNISVLKGSFARTLGLAAITGAGLGLAFTVFRSADSAWFIIPFLVVTLGMSPLLAGWMAPRLRYALFFPVSALVGFCIAAYNSESLTYDSGFFIVIPLTLIYGGAASLLFVAGWIAGQCYRQFRGRENTTSRLAIVSLVIVCYSIGLSISFYTWIPIRRLDVHKTLVPSSRIPPDYPRASRDPRRCGGDLERSAQRSLEAGWTHPIDPLYGSVRCPPFISDHSQAVRASSLGPSGNCGLEHSKGEE